MREDEFLRGKMEDCFHFGFIAADGMSADLVT